MTPDQSNLIRSSFAQLLGRKDAVGCLFYDRLFTIAPDLRPLFKSNIDEQARKLMDTLAVAVSAMREMSGFTKTLQELGHRHRSYGVGPLHYTKVGEALLWTLEKGLGQAFDMPTRQAWAELYDLVAKIMEPKLAR